jgi:hypothetical protein
MKLGKIETLGLVVSTTLGGVSEAAINSTQSEFKTNVNAVRGQCEPNQVECDRIASMGLEEYGDHLYDIQASLSTLDSGDLERQILEPTKGIDTQPGIQKEKAKLLSGFIREASSQSYSRYKKDGKENISPISRRLDVLTNFGKRAWTYVNQEITRDR